MNKIYKNLTGSKLKAYSAMAAVLTAGTATMNAEVVYTDITDATIGIGEMFEIDLDGDGTIDFLIAASSLTGVNGTWSFATAFGSVTALGVGGPSNLVMGTEGAAYNYASVLDAGDNIGSDEDFVSSAVLGSNYYGYVFGHFPGAGEGAIGVQFEISGNLHYGWIRLESDLNTVFVTVFDFAYESVPEIAIESGATTGGGVGVTELPTGAVNIYSFGSTLNVINNANILDANITVFDMSGKMIINQMLNTGSTQVDMSAFTSGNYIVKIDAKDGVSTKEVYIN
ncbi:MAG: T9SS type A sorting domain-containing protein [Bacteroidetes bacterium]|nr:T9SS type A sorting domain-containing protein [Bacteroidota bacterium]